MNKIIGIILIGFTLISLFACGKSNQHQSTTAPTQTENLTVTEKITNVEKNFYSFDKETKTLTIDGSKTKIITRNDFIDLNSKLNDEYASIETVVLTEGVKKIESQSFLDFKPLKQLILPASLSEIEGHVFSGCNNLAKITVNPQNQHFVTDEKGVLFTKDMTELIVYPPAIPDETYTMPQTVTTIRSNAFHICESLKNLHMSAKLSGNFTHWFYCCDNLEKVTFPPDSRNFFCDEQGIVYTVDTKEIVFVPSDLKTLKFPENADSFINHAVINNELITEIVLTETTSNIVEYLYQFPNLKKITVNEQNKNFSSLDGVLYNKDKTELLWYPPKKSEKNFTVPDTVESISFIRGELLENLIISDSVKIIDNSAFYPCKSLKYVHIGKGLEKFEYNDEFSVEHENIFSSCNNLEKITVASGNKNFKVDKYGALCTADMKNIITLPSNGKSEEYVINDKVIRILNCFENCKNLKRLHVGSSVEYINVGEADTETIVGFSGCVSLEEVTVSAKNEYYTSEDGVLYNKDKTKLCLYPANKPEDEFAIPDSVERAGDFAFLDNQNLKRIFSGTKTDPGYIYNFTSYQENYQLSVDIYYSGTKDEWPYDFLEDNPKIHFNSKGLPENE